MCPKPDIGTICMVPNTRVDCTATNVSEQVYAVLGGVCDESAWKYGTYVWVDQSGWPGSTKWGGYCFSEVRLDCQRGLVRAPSEVTLEHNEYSTVEARRFN